MTALTDMDWTDSQGAASVVVAGVKFLVVSVSKLEVMEKSKSRQFGIDVATAMGKKKSEYELVISDYDSLQAADVLHGVLVGFDNGAQWATKDSVKLPEKIFTPSFQKKKSHM